MSLKFTQSFEATPWAREFVRCVKRNPKIATDVDCMRGWFANAIMRGYDERERQAARRRISRSGGTPK